MPQKTSASNFDALLTTVEVIHAAAIDPDRWPQALALMGQVLGAEVATYEVFDRRAGQHHDFHAVGIPPAAEIAYFEHYIAENPRWLHNTLQRIGDIGWDYQFIDEKGMDRSAFYSELLARLKLRYFLSGVMKSTSEDFACVSVQYATGHGHADKAEIVMMERLLPHLRQAFDVSQRLDRARGASQPLERAFEWISDGVAILSATGAVVYANASLRAIAERADALRLRSGVLEFLAVDARSKFDAALGAVRRLGIGQLDAALPADFTVTGGPDRPPYIVSVRPLVASQPNGPTGAPGDVLVFVRDPLLRAGAASSILREAFGLTEAECGVAHALQDGIPLPHYARSQGVSINTVYTHLRRMREKTGCHSVVELIHKLDEFRTPLRPPRQVRRD